MTLSSFGHVTILGNLLLKKNSEHPSKNIVLNP